MVCPGGSGLAESGAARPLTGTGLVWPAEVAVAEGLAEAAGDATKAAEGVALNSGETVLLSAGLQLRLLGLAANRHSLWKQRKLAEQSVLDAQLCRQAAVDEGVGEAWPPFDWLAPGPARPAG